MDAGQPNMERIKYDRHVRDFSAVFSGGRARMELRTDGQLWAWFHSPANGGYRATSPRLTEAEATKDIQALTVDCANCHEPGDQAKWTNL